MDPRDKAKQILELLNGIGSLAEMAHHFYGAMINAGADKAEATAGMQTFITTYWTDAMNNARREKRENEQAE